LAGESQVKSGTNSTFTPTYRLFCDWSGAANQNYTDAQVVDTVGEGCTTGSITIDETAGTAEVASNQLVLTHDATGGYDELGFVETDIITNITGAFVLFTATMDTITPLWSFGYEDGAALDGVIDFGLEFPGGTTVYGVDGDTRRDLAHPILAADTEYQFAWVRGGYGNAYTPWVSGEDETDYTFGGSLYFYDDGKWRLAFRLNTGSPGADRYLVATLSTANAVVKINKVAMPDERVHHARDLMNPTVAHSFTTTLDNGCPSGTASYWITFDHIVDEEYACKANGASSEDKTGSSGAGWDINPEWGRYGSGYSTGTGAGSGIQYTIDATEHPVDAVTVCYDVWVPETITSGMAYMDAYGDADNFWNVRFGAASPTWSILSIRSGGATDSPSDSTNTLTPNVWHRYCFSYQTGVAGDDFGAKLDAGAWVESDLDIVANSGALTELNLGESARVARTNPEGVLIDNIIIIPGYKATDPGSGSVAITTCDNCPAGETWTATNWEIDAAGRIYANPTLGSDLLTDGEFENWDGAGDLTSWTETLGGSSTFADGNPEVYKGSASARSIVDSGSQVLIKQADVATQHKLYQVEFFQKSDTASELMQTFIGFAALNEPDTDGVFTKDFSRYIASGIWFSADDDFSFDESTTASVDVITDNMTLKEITLAETLATVDAGEDDVYISVELHDLVTDQTYNTSSAGIAIAVDDETNPANGVFVVWNTSLAGQDQIQILKLVAGVWSVVDVDTDNTYADGQNLTVVKRGTTYTLWYDYNMLEEIGTSGVITIDEATINTNTRHGLFSTSNIPRFDNFVIFPEGNDGEYSFFAQF
jgi:hypothetical protein